MGKADHNERDHLYSVFVCMMDGIRKRLLQILVFAQSSAIVVIYGLNSNRHSQAARQCHFLHKSAVAELIDSYHSDETPLFSAEQCKQLGAVLSIRKKIIVGKLQICPWVKLSQLIDFSFEHVQRLRAIRPHIA